MQSSEIISVIIPIFNTDEYLSSCIESVISQTYKNLEIILVNDGSSDRCPIICDNFAKRDKRIKVIHKDNGGVSSARNLGIDMSSGEFITFVDSDDVIENDMIELLYRNLLEHKCDMSICNHAEYYGKIRKLNNKNEIRILSSDDGLTDMLYQRSIFNAPYAKLYKKLLFSSIRYPLEIIVGEDLEVTYKTLSNAARVAISSSQKYYYRQRAGSAVKSKFDTKRMTALRVTERIIFDVEKKHASIVLAAINRHFMEAVFILILIPIRSQFSRNERVICKNIIKKYRAVVIKDKSSRLTYRMYALASYLGCDIIFAIFRIKNFIRNLIGRVI